MSDPRDLPPRVMLAFALLLCVIAPIIDRITVGVDLFPLYAVAFASIAAALAYLTVWLSMGTEAFPRRLFTAWGLIAIGAALLWGIEGRLADGERWQTLVILFLSLQLPLWTARFYGLRLNRGEEPAKEYWRLQHCAIGAVIGGAVLTLLRGEAREHPRQLAEVLIWTPLLTAVALPPAVWYTLNGGRIYRAHGWFALHFGVLMGGPLYLWQQSSAGFGRAIASAVCWIAGCALIGGYLGLLVMRRGGYRLTRSGRTTPTTAAALTSPRPGPE